MLQSNDITGKAIGQEMKQMVPQYFFAGSFGSLCSSLNHHYPNVDASLFLQARSMKADLDKR